MLREIGAYRDFGALRNFGPVREVRPHQSYLTTGDPRVHFGLGDATQVDRITVQWPRGSKESWGATEVDQVITLTKGTGEQ